MKESARRAMIGGVSGLIGCGLGMFLLRTLGGEEVSSKGSVFYILAGVFGALTLLTFYLMNRRRHKDRKKI